MTTKLTVQEPKAEQVREESAVVTEEPFRLSLKAERVQEPAAFLVGPDPQWVAAFDLSLHLSPKQPVRIELTTLGTVITL